MAIKHYISANGRLTCNVDLDVSETGLVKADANILEAFVYEHWLHNGLYVSENEKGCVYVPMMELGHLTCSFLYIEDMSALETCSLMFLPINHTNTLIAPPQGTVFWPAAMIYHRCFKIMWEDYLAINIANPPGDLVDEQLQLLDDEALPWKDVFYRVVDAELETIGAYAIVVFLDGSRYYLTKHGPTLFNPQEEDINENMLVLMTTPDEAFGRA